MIECEQEKYGEAGPAAIFRQTCLSVIAVLVGIVAVPARAADTTETQLSQSFASTVFPFLKGYCLGCHGETTQEAKLDLSGFKSLGQVASGHQTWEIVLDRLRANEMPPEDADRQPDARQRDEIVRWIQNFRDYEATRNAGDPGPVLARRLSNAEYNYSIRDLTGVDIQPTRTFPVDPANEAGFDNTGESLTMSPALLGKYLKAARFVAEHLVLTPDGITFAPHPAVTMTDRDKFCVKRIVEFYFDQPTELTSYFFAAWKFRHRGASGNTEWSLTDVAELQDISPKYLATVWELLTDGEDSAGPIARLREMWLELPSDPGQSDDAWRGCLEMREFVLGLRSRLKPTFPRVRVEEVHVGSQTLVLWRNRQHASHRRKWDARLLKVREESTDTEPDDEQPEGDSFDEFLLLPEDEAEHGAYAAAMSRFCSVFPDAFFISERGRDYVEESKKQMGERGRLLSAGFHSMLGYFRDDQPLYELILDEAGQRKLDSLWDELNFVTSAPMRQYEGFLWFERTDSKYLRDPQFDFARSENRDSRSDAMIRKLGERYLEKAIANGAGEVEQGAISDYFRQINDQIRAVESARIEAAPAHLQALLEFASRAYRRTLSESERTELKSFYQLLRDDGLTHEEAIQDTLVSILMSPQFCYRVDLIGIGPGTRPLTDEELASRLSYFLWSSTPDRQLLEAAANGELQKRDALLSQLRRMLDDERVRALAVEFAGNWLDFRRFNEHNSVDRDRFPTFDDQLRKAMFEEPVRFFMDVVQHDRSVLSLIDGRHTYVNSVLARHYGIPDEKLKGIPRTVTASTADGSVPPADPKLWTRFENADQYDRGGLLPMSVFLTKNAPGLRTSPVKRGYWVVRRLLGERIPPPPPNVPELPDDESKLGDLTLREALAKHRDNPSCAGCHERFDSLGLAFESFGPIGERRKVDLGGRPVSTAATFPGGHEADGLADLRQYLLDHRRDEFLDNLCRKLLSYALGRSLILSDELLIREMRERLEANEFRFSSLIEAIVTSPQFLTKRGSGRLARN